MKLNETKAFDEMSGVVSKNNLQIWLPCKKFLISHPVFSFTLFLQNS